MLWRNVFPPLSIITDCETLETERKFKTKKKMNSLSPGSWVGGLKEQTGFCKNVKTGVLIGLDSLLKFKDYDKYMISFCLCVIFKQSSWGNNSINQNQEMRKQWQPNLCCVQLWVL